MLSRRSCTVCSHCQFAKGSAKSKDARGSRQRTLHGRKDQGQNCSTGAQIEGELRNQHEKAAAPASGRESNVEQQFSKASRADFGQKKDHVEFSQTGRFSIRRQ